MKFSEVKDFQVAVINDIKVLWTDLRINFDTLPEGLFGYDIREYDDLSNYASIEKKVIVNHGATIITDRELPMPREGFIEIEDWSIISETDAEPWMLPYLPENQ